MAIEFRDVTQLEPLAALEDGDYLGSPPGGRLPSMAMGRPVSRYAPSCQMSQVGGSPGRCGKADQQGRRQVRRRHGDDILSCGRGG